MFQQEVLRLSHGIPGLLTMGKKYDLLEVRAANSPDQNPDLVIMGDNNKPATYDSEHFSNPTPKNETIKTLLMIANNAYENGELKLFEEQSSVNRGDGLAQFIRREIIEACHENSDEEMLEIAGNAITQARRQLENIENEFSVLFPRDIANDTSTKFQFWANDVEELAFAQGISIIDSEEVFWKQAFNDQLKPIDALIKYHNRD